MGRLSARSNPTGLKELEKGRVSIQVSEESGVRGFSLTRFDTSGKELAGNLKVFVIAQAGNTSRRYDMGEVAKLSTKRQSLQGLDRSQPLRFRLLVRKADDPRLVASVESLRAKDESQSESLLPMEPADLGERVWRVVVLDDGPVLLFNSAVYPSAAGASNNLAFRALVLPEAVRQVMERIAESPDLLEEEGGPWNGWTAWLTGLGLEPPAADGDDEARDAWCNEVVARFCLEFEFASQLGGAFAAEGGQG